ncbi:unnamed protein product [Linum tenue]|uniref:PROP1-like PPR domain-containing protein n=1 Tax=Linum tenue TaxID=586396 RepID=A0AAV0MX10_9ROSI|nr:unnamed protein product [Linum tenue]
MGRSLLFGVLHRSNSLPSNYAAFASLAIAHPRNFTSNGASQDPSTFPTSISGALDQFHDGRKNLTPQLPPDETIIRNTDKVCKLLSKESNNPNNLERLLDEASIQELSPTLALEVLKRLSNAGVLALSFFRWAEKQKERYARAKRVKEAIDAFEKMGKYGFKMESSDFNRLLDTLCKSRQIKSYTILLEGWCQEKNLLRLNEVYMEMKDEGLDPDVVTYSILLNAYCKVGKYSEAINLFHDMESKNCNPNPHIFCTLINGLGSVKRLKEAIEFFERSKACGFAPEAPTYNAVIGAYCWSLKIDDAFRTVDEMRRSGVGPNSRTYDIILHHLVKNRRTEAAYSVFQRMRSEAGCEPTLSTYEIVVRMFCNEDKLDMAVEVWNQMKGRGILPGMHMFSKLITTFCQNGKVDDACKYFQEMLDVGIRPPAALFSNLKETLVENGHKVTASNLAEKMRKLRKTPLDASLLTPTTD